MRTIIHKLIAGFLALALFLTPVTARAQSLLGDRLPKAFDAGRTIEITMSFDLDDSLGMLGGMPPENFAAAKELLRATILKISATRVHADQLEIGCELRMRDTLIVNGRMWLAGDKLAVTTNLLPGKTLMVDAAEFFQKLQGSVEQITMLAEDLQALGASVGNCAAIAADWMNSTEGIMTVNEAESPATQWRDASVQNFSFRVTSGQLKELFSKWAEEFRRAAAMMQVVPLDITPLEEIQTFVLTDNVIEWTVYMDEQGGIAGVTGTVPTMFGEDVDEARFSYDHLSAGNPSQTVLDDAGLERRRFAGEVRAEGAGTASFALETANDMSDPLSPKGTVHVDFHQSDKESSTTLLLKHTYARTLAANRETLESKTRIDGQIQSHASGDDDLMDLIFASMGDVSFSAMLDIASETRAERQDDFVCETASEISIMGMALGRVLVQLASGAYVPADIAGNEIIDLAGLDGAGQAALSVELNAGREHALELATSQIPEVLLQIMQ